MTEVDLAIAINKINRALFDLELQARTCKEQYKPTTYEAGMMLQAIREINEGSTELEAAINKHILNQKKID
jgi:hypothetical protein